MMSIKCTPLRPKYRRIIRNLQKMTQYKLVIRLTFKEPTVLLRLRKVKVTKSTVNKLTQENQIHKQVASKQKVNPIK